MQGPEGNPQHQELCKSEGTAQNNNVSSHLGEPGHSKPKRNQTNEIATTKIETNGTEK